ncbi:YdhK family protein [Paenisporosarcina quisquiliarum]|uniref:YdhK family protein n=1 Tax=Paenisporosarcina quisquiliarum TaxID=365346 RepID=A0A9X3RCR8_9BACL|nr:YdhK family protein [Paenisporosarcina quisquiliarum]MCZ8537060.1 YdhK family protein [Paenisporosarcina quisquiliarum]
MKKKLLYLSAAALMVLSGCGNETSNDKEANHEEMNHGGSHSSSGEVPEGLKEATNPTFEVGSKATITTDHMKGMKDAEATIVGAYDTTVYTISYTPTTGGEKVEDHKWIIHEEIKDPGANPYEAGDEVIVEADHMEGMKGATAVIDSAEQTTVYMVDYTSTENGEEVKNHKWVTESELSTK